MSFDNVKQKIREQLDLYEVLMNAKINKRAHHVKWLRDKQDILKSIFVDKPLTYFEKLKMEKKSKRLTYFDKLKKRKKEKKKKG